MNARGADRRAALLATLAAALATAAPAEAADAPPVLSYLQVEQLEYRHGGGGGAVTWEAFGWIGGDYDKAWLKTEGERDRDGGFEKAEVQLLYSRLLDQFFDVQVGLRQDFRPEPGRSYGAAGILGELPYGIEMDLAGFVSDRGDLSARLELEYDLPITQDLVLQPKLELDAALQDVPELEIGRGLTEVETGLRLRYHLSREFAPYIGIGWERLLGRSTDLDGDDTSSSYATIGVRFWF